MSESRKKYLKQKQNDHDWSQNITQITTIQLTFMTTVKCS